MKDGESWDKLSTRAGKDTNSLGKAPETFRCAGDPDKRDRWTVSRMQPESEEARPVARGERTAKSCG